MAATPCALEHGRHAVRVGANVRVDGDLQAVDRVADRERVTDATAERVQVEPQRRVGLVFEEQEPRDDLRYDRRAKSPRSCRVPSLDLDLVTGA